MDTDRIDAIYELTGKLDASTRAELLRAIADLIASYPASKSPWASDFAKFSDPGNATGKGSDDKVQNTPNDDAERLRKLAESLDPKPEASKRGST